jgi:hypothetical protein
MSFNYLDIPYFEILELKMFKIRIDNKFQDFASLDKYQYIVIDEWDRDYPLPPLPNGIIVLEILCSYKFPLNNLPQNIEVLSIWSDEYNQYKFPLDNLPTNLYHLEFNGINTIIKYEKPINFLPESLKILNLYSISNQSSYNLPIKLKSLEFSSYTFTAEEIVDYPPELEKVFIRDNSRVGHYISSQEKLEQLNKHFNLINLPLSIRILELPDIKISNLEGILKRLIHLEELYIPNFFENTILEYPPNLVKLYISGYYDIKYKLVNLPASLKYISLGIYSGSLDAVANSNIEHIELEYDTNLSIINHLPKSLKKLNIFETHNEFNRIKAEYPQLEINT